MFTFNLKEFALIRSIKEGDKEAFKVLYNRYFTPLCAYAVTFVKFSDVAEEIVQETFIRLWENRSQLNIDLSLRAYLYRCIHNNCISYLRNMTVNAKRSQHLIDELTYHANLASRNFTEDILENIISGEFDTHLNKAIDELPEQCKKIFCLSRYEQLSYKEIADKVGISVNTVKTQLSRAFDKLREAWNNFEKK